MLTDHGVRATPDSGRKGVRGGLEHGHTRVRGDRAAPQKPIVTLSGCLSSLLRSLITILSPVLPDVRST